MTLIVMKDASEQRRRFGMRAQQRSLQNVQVDCFIFRCRIHSGQSEVYHHELGLCEKQNGEYQDITKW